MRIHDKFDIVLFDGVCNLCNNAVDFIIKRDKNNAFKFAALQDKAVKSLFDSFQIKQDYLDSLILIRQDKVYYRSRAALEISKKLSGLWPLLYGFIIIPAFLRDPIYDWIAKNRYKWFGKKDTCRIPTKKELDKFLTDKDFI
ncbi:thiol-disulfide oxidoreductase DCC family protein [Cecembia calidifontis]|jgi:predicted DCC family thiol-disulfide oxidoreductase YuxK|uniref:Putative DCC family thiol-disulfide oxidoreductase YuxK n=1 Tax=Cecembia calidifontis TaxID=1187080 RepID=A0A4Q7PF29_9BACT|nr:DCC1-like thiol-disulfide oxidoreductase family protein [Cecembia calidifontis]RZS98418.1 putative DCC family thiol-disulfide oxidoreductase YuxK [Cecembia calidifontis]